MDTTQIKAYAPKARNDFIQAVTERANRYGIYGDDRVEAVIFDGDVAMIGDRAVTRKEGELQEKLVSRMRRQGFEMLIRSIAYTWFNRFVALRFMEIHDYLGHGLRVLSDPNTPDSEAGAPEIISRVADLDLPGLDTEKAVALRLDGNKDNELYRMLIVAQCNALHDAMPFLFDPVDSEAELLLPDNLLHSDSPIRKLVESIDESQWQDVEIIGWIYQFYISEKKSEVIGKVVKSEDIPAATQLFTPNWIVKYMVQNTLGRMWLATYPDSSLRDKMDFYIEPAGQEPEVQKQIDAITPNALNPEELTFMDPACGSGHILVEAYDIFKEIYLERGYRTRDIPRLILEKNLFGLDICDRAAQLAAFAVLMKARLDDRKILSEDVRLNILSIQSSQQQDARNIGLFFQGDEYAEVNAGLKELVALFEDAKTFGSLITIPEYSVEKMDAVEDAVAERIGKRFKQGGAQNLVALVRQAGMLAGKYDCVVMNPPYMGNKGMNPVLKDFARKYYPASKSDLFAMFIEKSAMMAKQDGLLSLITMQSWMFLSSYEKVREWLIRTKTLSTMLHLGARAFSTISGEVVQTTAFTFFNQHLGAYRPKFYRLVDGDEKEKLRAFFHGENAFHNAKLEDFQKIPGSPIAYWASNRVLEIFSEFESLSKLAKPRQGLATSDNDRFLKQWFEVGVQKIGFDCENHREAEESKKKWFPCQKGGPFRKWYGNYHFVVNWENNGKELMEFAAKLYGSPTRTIKNIPFYFNEGMTWSTISSSSLSMRYSPKGFISETKGAICFAENHEDLFKFLGFCNSKLVNHFLRALSPTLDYHEGPVGRLPVTKELPLNIVANVSTLVARHKDDWDSYETSWEFTSLHLLNSDYRLPTLKTTYQTLRAHWWEMTLEMQRLEEENNRIFIETYGLQDELTPDVPLNEITLTCNPHYRYGGNKTEEELEAQLQTDTIKELISYAIGCMMGRYSLDEPGLIYAHAGNIGFEPSRYQTFPADEDGILPVLDQEWFQNGATPRFREFIETAWPPENLSENLKFVADSLGPKNNEDPIDTIRRYISTTFFKDHLRMYKKRPIYWLFSSGRHKAFECLVYLHRYNESTLSRMRSIYVTPLLGNFSARMEYLKNDIDAATTASAKKKIQKELDVLTKKHEELIAFDDQLRHLADRKIALDLDDGVKVNYGKFGALLAEIGAVVGK